MRVLARAVCFVLAGILSASTASAAIPLSRRVPPEARPAGIASPKGVNAPESYGIDDPTRISLLSYAFQGRDPHNDQILDDGDSYRAFTSDTNTSLSFAASVSIPAGATITRIGFDNCDNTPLGTLSLALVDRFDDHNSILVAFVDSTDSSVCGFNNFTLTSPYPHDNNVDHVFELYTVQGNFIHPTLKFRSAYVEYLRRVSPAPGIATFDDVPTSDIYFQFIEALASSGITVGCDAVPNYCPDRPITRAEMAVFLAKALGLHFPN